MMLPNLADKKWPLRRFLAAILVFAAVLVLGSAAPAAKDPNARLQFVQLTEEVYASLPTVETVRAEVAHNSHSTPSAILTAGYRMGRIVRRVHENPEFTAEGLAFFNRCQTKASLPNSLRELCRELSAQLKK